MYETLHIPPLLQLPKKIPEADRYSRLAKMGRCSRTRNNFFSGALPANPLTKREFSDPTVALQGATGILQLPVSGEATAEKTERIETTPSRASGAVSDPEARLVYFVKEDNSLALTWRIETDIVDNWLLTYVDATTNEEVHGVVDYVAHATYEVFEWGLNDPDEGSRTTIQDPWLTSASPFTWHNDGSKSYNTTRGNNGIAQTNPSGGSAYLNNYRPTSANLRLRISLRPEQAADHLR